VKLGQQEIPEQAERLVHQVLLVPQDQQEQVALSEPVAQLEQQVPLELEELVAPVQPAQQEPVVQLDQPDQRVLPE